MTPAQQKNMDRFNAEVKSLFATQDMIMIMLWCKNGTDLMYLICETLSSRYLLSDGSEYLVETDNPFLATMKHAVENHRAAFDSGFVCEKFGKVDIRADLQEYLLNAKKMWGA